MHVVNLVLPPPPPSAARNLLQQHAARANTQLTVLANLSSALFKEFWYGPVPVEQLLETLGEKACDWFAQHERTVQFLLTSGVVLDPASYTPPLAYTKHLDGRITLNPS